MTVMQTFKQFISIFGSIAESPVISYKAEFFGFILPSGEAEIGESGETHASMSKRLGLIGWDDALRQGYIRFAIGYNGDATFNLVWSSRTKANLLRYLSTAKELVGEVSIEYEQGKDSTFNSTYREYDDAHTAETAVRGLPANVSEFPKPKSSGWGWFK